VLPSGHFSVLTNPSILAFSGLHHNNTTQCSCLLVTVDSPLFPIQTVLQGFRPVLKYK